jgi:hypothetical protein
MPIHLLPIEGLVVPSLWRVGPVLLHSIESFSTLLEQEPRPVLEGYNEHLGIAVESFDRCTAAQVDADDLDEAFELVSMAVDLLLVFKEIRHGMTETTTFGMPGHVQRQLFSYFLLDPLRTGWRKTGHRPGWTFTADAVTRFNESATFQFIADNIGCKSSSDGARRAQFGVQLFAQGIRERRPALTLVSHIAGLEAMIMPASSTSQTFRLARHVAFFGCGRHDGDLCGRTRDVCPYLAIDPSDGDRARRKLKRLEERARLGPPWLCSEWLRVIDWYKDRSGIVHGEFLNLDRKRVQSDQYWVLHNLAEPILDWLCEHPEDPIGELLAALAALPEPPDWDAMLGTPPSPSE